jgi:SSS family solute:Na+ symporter
MLWGICALTLFGTGALIGGVPSPVVHGKVIEPLNAMPAMLAQILGPGIRGLVVAGMLAATMSVNSSYLLGWSSVISQDIILPIRQFLGKPLLSSNAQILVNRITNLFVSLFVMFWGLYYRLPDVVYKYLNITATIFLAGSFISVVGGIYWKRASTLGGYFAMSLGAVGAIIPLLPESFTWIPTVLRNLNIAGFLAFGCALTGFVLGSLISDLRKNQEPMVARRDRH